MRRLGLEDSGLDAKLYSKLKRLDSPRRIQDFLDSLPFNFEEDGLSYRSVEASLKAGRAHCFEGALIAAAALWIRGERPLLMDIRTDSGDDDHVVALFKRGRSWGALSKTNHAVLRYREPVYRDPREIAMSYFHEYFLDDGRKTMRSFSKPFDLSKVKDNWLSSGESLESLVVRLDRSPHTKILSQAQIKNLRRAGKIEVQATKLAEWRK